MTEKAKINLGTAGIVDGEAENIDLDEEDVRLADGSRVTEERAEQLGEEIAQAVRGDHTDEQLREELREAAAELAAADAARAAALKRIGRALEEGEGRLTIKEMAELAGITRVTAYRLLGRDPAPGKPRTHP